ncbi:MAG: hypothetical protein JXR97_01935 [Planctomycetes bacterium]|nr:hypothetical protein [Planctomycetota bacterium]
MTELIEYFSKMSPFEAGMLVCFGASWPFAVYKTWKTKSCHAKSFAFMWLIFIGYISGIIHRTWWAPNAAIWLYILNGALVFTDIALSYRYRNNPPPKTASEG